MAINLRDYGAIEAFEDGKLQNELIELTKIRAGMEGVDPMDYVKTFSGLGYTRNQLVGQGFHGAVALPGQYDLQPEVAKRHILHRGRDSQTYGLIKGMLFDRYNEAIIAPRWSSDDQKYREGSKAARHFRIPVEYIPDGTEMFSMLSGEFFTKRVADGDYKTKISGDYKEDSRGSYLDEDGNNVDDASQAVRKPLLFTSREAAEAYKKDGFKSDVARTNLVHYWEFNPQKDGEYRETGKVTEEAFMDHQLRYGYKQYVKVDRKFDKDEREYLETIIRERIANDPSAIQTKDDGRGQFIEYQFDPEGPDQSKNVARKRIYFSIDKDSDRIYLEQLRRLKHHIPQSGKTVGDGESINKYPDMAWSQASFNVYSVNEKTGEIEEDRWLYHGGHFIDPKTEYPFPKMSDKGVMDLVSNLGTSKSEFDKSFMSQYRWIYSGGKEDVPEAFNDWKEPERAVLFSRLKSRFEELFADAAIEMNEIDSDILRKYGKTPGKSEQEDMNQEVIKRKSAVMKKYTRQVDAFFDKGAKASAFNIDTKDLLKDENISVGKLWHSEENAKQRLVYFGMIDKYAAPPHTVDRKGKVTPVYTGKEVWEMHPTAGSRVWLHSTGEKTLSPLGGGMRSGAFSGGNRPAMAHWDKWYYIDAMKHEYARDHIPGYQIGGKGYTGTKAHRKAQKVIQWYYENEMGTTDYGDALPYLAGTMAIGKQWRELKLGAGNFTKGLLYLGAGAAVGAAVGIGISLLAIPAGIAGTAAVAATAAIAAVPAAFGGYISYKGFAETRYDQLSRFEKQTEFDVFKLYRERADRKGKFGLGGFKDDWSIMTRALRSLSYIALENRDTINRWDVTGMGLVVLGVTAAIAGGVGIAAGLLGATVGAPVMLPIIGAKVAGAVAVGIATAAAGLLAAGAGLFAKITAKEAEKGRIHFMADYFDVVGRAGDKNKDVYGNVARDTINRVPEWRFERLMPAQREHIDGVLKANAVLDARLGIKRAYMTELEESLDAGFGFGIGRESTRNIVREANRVHARYDSEHLDPVANLGKHAARFEQENRIPRVIKDNDLSKLSHAERVRLRKSLSEMETSNKLPI